jgi:hypothetical protein
MFPWRWDNSIIPSQQYCDKMAEWLSARVREELVGEVVAREMHFRLLNNTTQESGVS